MRTKFSQDLRVLELDCEKQKKEIEELTASTC